MAKELSVVIVNWNTRDLLESCLQSIFDTVENLDFDVWVVDNASTDGSVEMVRERFPRVRLFANTRNVGFARANNQAMSLSRGRFLLLFNSDAVATPAAIEAMVRLADSQPDAGIVGAQLINPDGSFQASYSAFPGLWQEFLILTGLGRMLRGPWYPSHGPEEVKGPQVVDYVEGACLLVRRSALPDAGALDEGYFMYSEEVDWCYTMRKSGWEVWYAPEARIIHHGGGSSRSRKTQREADLYRSRVRFFRKHHGPAAAAVLKALIYSTTAAKILVHGALRFASRNRRGRQVVGMNDLVAQLRDL